MTKIGKNIGSLTDDARTFLTEDGPPAQNLRTFTTETLHRENRWICHYGLMAVAAIKKVHLIIWQYNEGEDEPWTKIAVISPNEDLKQLPAIHLAKDGGHYMPLISDTIQIPGNDLLGNGRVRRAKGIQSKIKKETKKNIRAGGGASGEHDPDAIRHTPNLKHDKADFEEETIEDLLKPPRKALDTPLSSKTQKSTNIQEILRTPRTPATPLSIKKTAEKDTCNQKASKTRQWACPFCQFQCHNADPGKRNPRYQDSS